MPYARSTSRNSQSQRRVGTLRTRYFLSLFVILLNFYPDSSAAQSVKVKARTSIWAKLIPGSLEIEGTLDDDRNEKLENQRMLVKSEGSVLFVTSGQGGRFKFSLPHGSRMQKVRIEYMGSDYYEPSFLDLDIDPTRLPVDLKLYVPTIVSLRSSKVEAQVRATQGQRPVEIVIDLIHKNTSTVISRSKTDENGWASIPVEAKAFGRPGRHELHARFSGHLNLAPALARAEFFVVDATDLSLRADQDTILPGDRLRLSGNLIGTYEPLEGEKISLNIDQREFGETITSSGGSFSFKIHSSDFAEPGSHVIVARYHSENKSRESSDSDPVTIVLNQPEPLDTLYVFVSAAVTLVLLFIILLVTRRFRNHGAEGVAVEKPAESGLRLSAPPSLRSRKPELRNFSGIVWDPIEKKPVPHAKLTLLSRDGESLLMQSSEEGSFYFDDLKTGEYQARAEAPGYLVEKFVVSIPHSGAFIDTRLDIIQIRHRALEMYRAVALPLLPKTFYWGRWTPRELAIFAVENNPWLADSLTEITSSFESIYYSPGPKSPDDLDLMRRLASKLDRNYSDNTHARTGG